MSGGFGQLQTIPEAGHSPQLGLDLYLRATGELVVLAALVPGLDRHW